MRIAWMRITWLIGLVALALAVPAEAQRGPGRGGREGDQMGPGRGQARGLRGEIRGPRGRMPFGVMANRLAEELELSDEQQQLYEEIVDKHEARMEERRGQGGGMRELGRQYREARQAGDDELAAEIREKMRTMVGGRGQMADEFIADVETILEPAQVEKLRAFGDRMRQRGDARRMLRTLPEDLGLSEEQRAQYEDMMREHREQIGQRMREWREARSRMQDELREAEEAGDEDLATDLHDELMRARPAPPEFGGLFDQLEKILTDEQKAKLAELRQTAEPERPPAEPIDVRALLRAAKRLDLNPEQTAKFKDIMRTAQQADRQGPAGRAGRAERSKLVKDQIIEILTPQQREQFEKLLDQDRGRRGEGRGRGADRGGRRGGGEGRGRGPGGPGGRGV